MLYSEAEVNVQFAALSLQAPGKTCRPEKYAIGKGGSAVSQPATRSRLFSLRAAFQARGVYPGSARVAAGVLNARYPVIIAAGVAGVTRRLQSRGASEQLAVELAPTLLAFEMLDRGSDLGDAVRMLERQGLSLADAQGTAFEAANLLRDTAERLPPPIMKRIAWPRWCAGAAVMVGFLLAAAATL